MELFDEVKNRYFHIVLRALSECGSGLSKKDIISILEEEEFEERAVGRDFQSFQGLLLNQYEPGDNYNLLKEEGKLFYPVMSEKGKNTVPVRFTALEKVWLKALAEEPSAAMVLSKETLQKLRETLKEVDTPISGEVIELTNKSLLPEPTNLKQYEDNFKIILKAIVEEKAISYCNTDRAGNEYCGMLALPIRLEYSIKDNRFRVSLFCLKNHRPIVANVGTMSSIEIMENCEISVTREEVLKLLHKNRYSKEPIVLEVTDKKSAMERCFMSFSELERSSRCLEQDKYEIKLNYYTFEEEDIIRKILALGPYVKVLSPQRIIDEIVKRIKKAIELNTFDLGGREDNKMIEIKGKYNTAKVYTDNLEPEVISQVMELCNQDFCKDSRIAIMPDTHAGKGCVIGFTANLGDKVIPNIVGVDIGCGMLTVELGKTQIDLKLLDEVIRKHVPSGKGVHEGRMVKFPKLQELNCYRELQDTKRIDRSIGTLGGGNHFIEVDKDEEGNLYLVIHSGSRNLGKQVAEFYQNLAIDICSGKEDYYKERERIITEYKKEGRRQEIQKALKELKNRYDSLLPSYPRELCFLTGIYRDKYLQDMSLCQEYALLNREVMANNILKNLLGKSLEDFGYFQLLTTISILRTI